MLSSPISQTCGVSESCCGRFTLLVEFLTPGYLSTTWWSTSRMVTRWRRQKAVPPRSSTSWRMWDLSSNVDRNINILNYYRLGILTRKSDPPLWRLETAWKSLKFRILSEVLWAVSPELSCLCLEELLWYQIGPRLITTFLFHLNNNKMPKPVII